jgi:hypothetical protein
MNLIWLRLLAIAAIALIVSMAIHTLQFKAKYKIDLFGDGCKRWTEMWKAHKGWCILAVANEILFQVAWNALPVAIVWEYLLRDYINAW